MPSVWTTQGFDGFSRGSCGNAGQNLYVSRAGVLQRIHQFSLTGSGYVDLIFCNSQGHWERPPVFVYRDPLGKRALVELPADGATCGAVADFNGDGYDDLVLGFQKNGISPELNAFLYYGGPDGLGERCHQRLHAPHCRAVAAGDFNGDGKPDLAFLTDGGLRVFYQTPLGFEMKQFVDLDLRGADLAAADLDGDGCADLVMRGEDGAVRVYWGGPDGIVPERCHEVAPGGPAETLDQPAVDLGAEQVADARPRAVIVRIGPVPHLFLPGREWADLVPVSADRGFGPARRLGCAQAMAVAVGDVDGDGHPDLVVAGREAADEGGENSWIYRGGPAGYSDARRTRLKTCRACDVAVGDLDGDGRAEIVICQNRTADFFTTESLIYRATRDGVDPQPVRLVTHDARRCFIARTSDDRPPQVIFVNQVAGGAHDRIRSYVYPGGPDGYRADRRVEIEGSGTVRALCADVNDDGRADLVMVNASEFQPRRGPGSYVLIQGPSGLPATPTQVLPTYFAAGGCCADVDRDGHLDLLISSYDSLDILLFRGTAGGFDTRHPERIRMERDGYAAKSPRGVYLADLNNDGWLDLVVTDMRSDRSFVLWGGPAGYSLERSQALAVWNARSAVAADLTGNGYLDLIVGGQREQSHGPHDSFVYIYWNGPDGLREDRRMLLPSRYVLDMTVADFNNDGRLDLFIGSYAGARDRDLDSYIYWNRPGRGFSASDFTRLFTHSVSGCIAADFNEDGWIDLAMANHKVWGSHVGDSMVWWNGPDGFDEKRVTRLPTIGPHGMAQIGPGNIRDRGSEEYYVSAPIRLPEGMRVTGLSWEAVVPSKTWVRGQLRFASVESSLAASPWIGPNGEGTWWENGQKPGSRPAAGPWVQYRLALGATNGVATPRVTRVDVTYGREKDG